MNVSTHLQIPFTLSSPALALLLVFRTNTVYARWNEARTAWARIEVHLCNLGRQVPRSFLPLSADAIPRKNNFPLVFLCKNLC
jgi:predicted membrane chloride channel (bestrophin family)